MKIATKYLKQFIPPILISLIKNKPLIRQHKDWNSAKDDAKHGYENIDLINLVIEKTINYSKQIYESNHCDISDLSPLISMSMIYSNSINVIDWGGGAGSHFYAVQKILPPGVKINWCVIETKTMVEQCKKRICEPGLHFYEHLDEAKIFLNNQIDLVFSNSALQYSSEPLSTIRSLIELQPENIFITRTPFSDFEDKMYFVQSSVIIGNGPGQSYSGSIDINQKVKYPLVIVNYQKVLDLLENDFNIKLSWSENNKAFKSKNVKIQTMGLMASKKL